MGAIGWYGPLIDLCEATSHVGDYVQLLVFVHRTRPFQKFKSLKGSLSRTDIQVGDNTRLFFNVTLWKKEMGSMVKAGDVVLLQNVTIVKYGGIIEAQSVLVSSLTTVVHSRQLLASEGINDQLAFPRVGETTKEKLKKLILWLQQDGLLLHQAQLLTCQKRQLVKNWKVNKEMKYQECISVSLVSSLTIS
ncbi:hypothetical protein Scep_019314 [Stephania cephalantha]|uniref:Uncharacterized protein n=1 Tax=Stephania cephalantha TaxID=152367 RepID=A0AAP0IAY3_9MAGN